MTPGDRSASTRPAIPASFAGSDSPGTSNFYDHQVYGGDSLLRAVLAAARWHRKCGCVTIKWRRK